MAQPGLLPGAPDIVLGVLNLGGELVTVIDFGRRIGLPATSICPAQRLLVIQISDFSLAFIVDEVLGVSDRALPDPGQLPGKLAAAEFVHSILRLEDGLCLIIDPEKFLFEAEKALLRAALDNA